MLKAYAIYDLRVQSFGTPFFSPSHEVCYRHMRRAVANKDLDVGAFPKDFDLYSVGSFDEVGGTLEGKIEKICNMTNFLQEKQ